MTPSIDIRQGNDKTVQVSGWSEVGDTPRLLEHLRCQKQITLLKEEETFLVIGFASKAGVVSRDTFSSWLVGVRTEGART